MKFVRHVTCWSRSDCKRNADKRNELNGWVK